MSLSCTLFEILVEIAAFNLPHLYLAPPMGVTSLECRRDLLRCMGN